MERHICRGPSPSPRGRVAPSELDQAESTISNSPDKPLARDDAQIMWNDLRRSVSSNAAETGAGYVETPLPTSCGAPFATRRNPWESHPAGNVSSTGFRSSLRRGSLLDSSTASSYGLGKTTLLSIDGSCPLREN